MISGSKHFLVESDGFIYIIVGDLSAWVGFAHQAHSRVSNIIAHAFNWFKSMGGFLHLKPTVGCQISTLIFEKQIMEVGLYKYPMKNILRTAKFLPTWGVNQRYFPGL